MSRSLLSRLPDLFACAAVRTSETMHALGLKPGQCLHGENAVLPLAESAAAPRWRSFCASDMPVLLSMLAGQAPFPAMRHQLGLLWLSTQSTLAASQGESGLAMPERLGAFLLTDFAHRLLLARELLSPSAVVVVECAPGLEEGVSLVVQTIFGHSPQWIKIDEAPGAALVLLCPVGAWATGRGPRQWHCANLLQWLRETPMEHRMALALGPTMDLNGVWRAWRGRWVVTHADPAAFEQLQLQSTELLAA